MKIIKRILLGLFAVILPIAIIGYLYFQPDYSGELTLTGLKEPVEVLYDDTFIKTSF